MLNAIEEGTAPSPQEEDETCNDCRFPGEISGLFCWGRRLVEAFSAFIVVLGFEFRWSVELMHIVMIPLIIRRC
jgi:hypothetical protein